MTLQRARIFAGLITAVSLSTIAACGGGGGGNTDGGVEVAPSVDSTNPASAATGVALNTQLTATFSVPMSAATLNSTTFTVSSSQGAVAGTVVYAGLTALFKPAASLAATTQYTATISTGATSATGIALAANYTWSATTGSAVDTTPPLVTSMAPANAATGVSLDASVSATFSETIDPSSVTGATFTLQQGATAIAGAVTVEGATALFIPSAPLSATTVYTATVLSAKDLAGNALAASQSWSFTTGTQAGLAPVLLGSSINYVLLAKSAISTVPSSVITGDVALSPAAASYLTGFGLTDATGYATSPQVVGKIYASDFAAPAPVTLTTAVSDMQTGYTDAAGRPTPDFLNLGGGALSGLTLTPGLYKWTTSVTIPGDITIAGNATDVWIFQITGDLSMSSAKTVTLTGGALAKNVFWQVAGAVDLGASSHFEGIILCQTSITLETSASMNGRALAQMQIALEEATVTQPAP